MKKPSVCRKIVALIWLCIAASPGIAACNFPPHTYHSELANPAEIKHIGVEIHKSRKWFKNSISILASKKGNIEDSLKDKLGATLTVHYSFGLCTYDARVRQSGDWQDHIKLLPGGNFVSSLDVKLLEGNILNAVRFKLLLPETRGGLNEVLGALLLRELNYIAPETFMVSADINGVQQSFLFQENTAKELLERNLRREGPIFEGDENVIWNIDGFEAFELENISLARLANDNWAEKGETSTKMALDAFQKLQAAYLVYGTKLPQDRQYRGVHLVPNPEPNRPGFETYALLMLAMNGDHSLRPHNRKYYFNSFIQAFEPIYYDGNLDLPNPKMAPKLGASPEDRAFYLSHADPDAIAALAERIDTLRNEETFRQAFMRRVGAETDPATSLFQDGLEMTVAKMRTLHGKMLENPPAETPKVPADLGLVHASLLKRTADWGIETAYLELNGRTDDGNYLARHVPGADNGETLELSPQEMLEVISENKYRKDRFVLLPKLAQAIENRYETLPFLDGEILVSAGAKVVSDSDARALNVSQTTANDWVLIRGATVKDWTITFMGVAQDASLVGGQRFNEFGLTGCLNFYDVTFTASTISAQDGQCEDSVNIVSSGGTLTTLLVEDGFADAIDIDFSQIAIDTLSVTRTGNDCFDVSTGQFDIVTARLSACGDKGISVGENSEFTATDITIDGAVIGVSSKDLSNTRITRFAAVDVSICAEAVQKKQEFGGGTLMIEDFKCEGAINQDAASSILLNGVMQ